MFVDDVEADGGDGADEAALFAVVVVVHGHEMALVVERLVEDDRRGGVAVLAEILPQRPLRSDGAVLSRLLDVGLPLFAERETALPLLDDLSLLLLDYSAVEKSGEEFKVLFRILGGSIYVLAWLHLREIRILIVLVSLTCSAHHIATAMQSRRTSPFSRRKRGRSWTWGVSAVGGS